MKNINGYSLTIINALFLIFPLSLILGNFFTNLNIILFSIFALIFYNKKIIKFKINFLDKIILIFFFYTLVVLLINFFENYSNNEPFSKLIIHKTFFYLRYLVFYLILRFLVSQKTLRLDWFSLACALCATFICLDILVQFFLGKDILGLEPYTDRHYSGVFGEELIAGGYLQKFALFSFFLPFVIKKNLFHKILILFIFFAFFLFGIVLSGNRMPLLLYIFSFLTFLIFNKKLRKYFFTILIITILSLTLYSKINLSFKVNVSNFYTDGKNLIHVFFLDVDAVDKPADIWKRPYVSEIACFKTIWNKNSIFGGGIKSYRTFYGGCGSHPHNYYLEILTDLGLIGLSIILFFIFMLLRKIFVKKTTLPLQNFNTLDNMISPFLLIFLTEFFPLRSTGSFFSTSNASIIFIILAILVSLASNKKVYN